MSGTSVRTKLSYNCIYSLDLTCPTKFLQQLSVTAEQGLTILVIGDPGSGKSTLVNNLLGVQVHPEDYCKSPNIPGLIVTTFKREFLLPSMRHVGLNLIALLNLHLHITLNFGLYSIVQMGVSLQLYTASNCVRQECITVWFNH